MSVRRLLTSWFPVLVVLIVLTSAAPCSAAKDYRAERFHSRVVVEPGGSIVVTETIRFVFGPDSFTYVFRELPSRRTDGILVLQATMDGQPMAPGKQAGQFELKKEDGGRRRIIWHFPATSNGARTVTLTYRAAGVAWQDTDRDVLGWTLLPTKHEYLIECASGEVEYPASALLLGSPRLDPPATDLRAEGRAVRFLRCPFERDRSWVVTLDFAPRSMASSPPAWQQKERLNREHLPLFLGLAALMLLGGTLAFVFVALNHRVPAGGERNRRRTTRPDDLAPALAGALVRTGTSLSWADVLAAIFDLARRGAIRIEVRPASAVFKKHEVLVTPGPAPRTLAAHERTLLDLLFTTRSGPRPSVTFSELGRTFGSVRRWKKVRSAVADDLRAAGLLDPEREAARGRVTIVGVAIMLCSAAGFAVSAAFVDQAGEPVLALPIAMIILGIIGTVTGATLSPLSDEGHSRAEQWNAWRRHMADVSRHGSGAALMPERLEEWLPYAVAFGTAAAWAKRLETQGVTDGPSWLRAVAREGGTGRANIGATIAVLSAGASAGAHVGGGAAGVAGAAGGGSSGAG